MDPNKTLSVMIASLVALALGLFGIEAYEQRPPVPATVSLTHVSRVFVTAHTLNTGMRAIGRPRPVFVDCAEADYHDDLTALDMCRDSPFRDNFIVLALFDIWVRLDGSDIACDGTVDAPAGSGACAYATVQRALDDINSLGSFSDNYVIHVGPGTWSTTQNWSLTAVAGYPSPPGVVHGRVVIVGDYSTPDLTIATTGAGTLVSGKTNQVTYNVGAYTATVSDGSHWLRSTTSIGTPAAVPLRTSSSPNLVVVSSTTTARNNVALQPYTTVFSAGARIAAVRSAVGTPGLEIVGIRFSGTTFLSTGVRFSGSISAGNLPTLTDSAMTGAFIGVPILFVGDQIISNTLFLNTFTVASGNVGGLTGVLAGGTNGSGHIQLGSVGSVADQTVVPSHIRTCNFDVEGTGDGIWLSNGSSINSCQTTFAITGRPVFLAGASRIILGHGSNSWTGSGQLPSIVRDGSLLKGNVGLFNVTNSATPGADVDVDGTVVAIGTSTNGVNFSRYVY